MKTILITNDPSIARDAQSAGISRIMVDLEWMGKKDRQASRTTFLSSHTADDIARIRAVLTTSELMVRLNPWNLESPAELEASLSAGADIIMLPMITRMADFDTFITALNGRAEALPLVETAYSMAHIAQIADTASVKEIYIGLNDLHLSLGLDFLFEPLALGLLDWMVERIRARGKGFGFGGLAMMGSGELPAEQILAEHVRLGSGCVILSSRFCKDVEITNPEGRVERLQHALALMQQAHAKASARTHDQMQSDATNTAAKIKELTRAVSAQRAALMP